MILAPPCAGSRRCPRSGTPRCCSVPWRSAFSVSTSVCCKRSGSYRCSRSWRCWLRDPPDPSTRTGPHSGHGSTRVGRPSSQQRHHTEDDQSLPERVGRHHELVDELVVLHEELKREAGVREQKARAAER